MVKKLMGVAVLICALAVAGCSNKREHQGKLVYSLTYELPDSLKSYIYYLPKEAVVYFKGDSAVTIQQTGDESTTVITNKKTGFMQALLKSPGKHYAINFNKADQDEERANMPVFEFSKKAATKTLAGYQAQQYILTDKMTGVSHEAWFTTAINVPQSSMSLVFDPSLGVPLVYTTNQNGIITHTTIKEIGTGDVPVGVFTVPTGYDKLTPRQLKEMPVDN